jgi:hypothetical protein
LRPGRRAAIGTISVGTASVRTTAGSTRSAAGSTPATTGAARSAKVIVRTITRSARFAAAAKRALSTGAAWSRTRGASRFEGLSLRGGENLIELGLGLFFECVNLLLLIFREVQLVDGERRDQMESGTETSGTTWAARSHSPWRTTAARAVRITGTILTRRPAGTAIVRAAGRTVLCTTGNGGNRKDAEKQKERWKTSHGNTPLQMTLGTQNAQTSRIGQEQLIGRTLVRLSRPRRSVSR